MHSTDYDYSNNRSSGDQNNVDIITLQVVLSYETIIEDSAESDDPSGTTTTDHTVMMNNKVEDYDQSKYLKDILEISIDYIDTYHYDRSIALVKTLCNNGIYEYLNTKDINGCNT